MTVLDQSPTIRYLPDRGVGKPRWQTNYQQNNPANYTRGALGRGSSSHFTENIGSGFTFNFKGTSIYIYGSAREDAYTMTISDSGLAGAEGRRMQPVGGTTPLLGWIDGLEDKWWTIDCNVTASTGFTITSIDFTVNIGPDNADLTRTEISAVNDAVTAPNSQFSLSGASWKTYRTAGGQVYPRISAQVRDARVTLPPLQGETFVLIYGPVNWNQRRFMVESSSPADEWPASTEWSAVSEYLGLDQISWFGAVKGGTISMQNLEGQQSRMDIAKVVYITYTGGSAAEEPNTGSGTKDDGPKVGAIVGGVLGGLAALAAIGVAIVWLRRRKRNEDYWRPGHFDAPSRGLTPYNESTDPHTIVGDGAGHEMAYTGTAAGTATASHGVSPFLATTRYQSDESAANSSSTNLLSPVRTAGDGSQGHLSSLVVHNADHPVTSPTVTSSKSPPPHTGPPQETDAGSLSAVPPSYNPAWAPPSTDQVPESIASPITSEGAVTASHSSPRPKGV